MTYPIVTEETLKSWYIGWRDECEKAWARVPPTECPQVIENKTGSDFDWATEVAAIIQKLREILEQEGDKLFEVRGAEIFIKLCPNMKLSEIRSSGIGWRRFPDGN